MACVLELPQLVEHDGPAERHVGGGGIESELHAQGSSEREFLLEPALGNDLGGPVLQQGEGVGSHGDRMLPVRSGATGRLAHVRKSPGLALVLFVVLATIASACGGAPRLSDYRKRALPLAQTSFLYASDGSLITELHAGVDRVILSRKQMPQTIRDAVVAIEDKRFYYHHGVDLRAIIRAAYADVAAGRIVEGGSTITQQLVKQLYVGDDETLRRKIDEAVLAWQLEDRLTKDQILTKYLNTVYFGQGAYGIQAARARTSTSTRRTSPSPVRVAGRVDPRAERLRPVRPPGARAGQTQQRAPTDARPGDDHVVPEGRGRRRADRAPRVHVP